MTIENKKFLDEQKQVAYYSALVNAWVTTRMEKDTQLLTLSSAGIGLIIIFQHKLSNVFQFILWIFAGICFLISIYLLLSIFSDNGDLIESEINERSLKNKLDKKILLKTEISKWLFIIGAVSAFVLAISQTNFIQIKPPQEGIRNVQRK